MELLAHISLNQMAKYLLKGDVFQPREQDFFEKVKACRCENFHLDLN